MSKAASVCLLLVSWSWHTVATQEMYRRAVGCAAALTLCIVLSLDVRSCCSTLVDGESGRDSADWAKASRFPLLGGLQREEPRGQRCLCLIRMVHAAHWGGGGTACAWPNRDAGLP
jgi:hypothetical protein